MLDRLRQWRYRVWSFNTFNRREWVAEEAARVPRGARVLDVGAGPGQYRPLFAHCEYLTQDFGQEPATIGKYTKLDFECDITAIPVESESFDAVLCTEVLEHVPEPLKALAEIARILKPGGKLLLTAPLGSLLHQEPYHYYGGYTPYFYRRFLPELGFEIEDLHSNQGFFSLFGQETQRYADLLRDPAVKRLPFAKRALLAIVRLLLWPLVQILPLAGNWLDALQLEQMATIGYHVVAVKRAHA
jgi:SAM-dependent methyltransferase